MGLFDSWYGFELYDGPDVILNKKLISLLILNDGATNPPKFIPCPKISLLS